MELVSWKVKDTNKSIFNTKIWEKFRNTKGKNKGKEFVVSSNSKFIHALKLAWIIVKNYKWL